MGCSFRFSYSSVDRYGNRQEIEFSASGEAEEIQPAASMARTLMHPLMSLPPASSTPPAYIPPASSPQYVPPAYSSQSSSQAARTWEVTGCAYGRIPYRGQCQFKYGLYYYDLSLQYQGQCWRYRDTFEQSLTGDQLDWVIGQLDFKAP